MDSNYGYISNYCSLLMVASVWYLIIHDGENIA